MPWLRVDDGFANHPKILALGNDQARWTWLCILLYAARYSTPRLPANLGDSIPQATPAYLKQAVENQLLDIDDDGRYTIHDWDYYNPGDPTNAARQARYRHRKRTSVTANVTANVTPQTVTPPVTPVTQTTVTQTVTPVTPPAPAAARVPSPNNNETNVSSSSNRNAENDDDDELDHHLAAAGIGPTDRQLARRENPARVRACLDAAQANGRNPAAYFHQLLTSGEWPLHSPGDGARSGHAGTVIDANDAAGRWLDGVGWDESFDEGLVEDEFDRIESSPRTSGTVDRPAMLDRWRQLRAERFPQDTGVPA